MKCGPHWKALTVSQTLSKPPFRRVSPLVYASAWTFALLNIFFLAPAFLIGTGARGLSLVGLVPSKVWGIIFILMGVGMIYSLVTNKWAFIKNFLITGLAVKAMFAWALVFTLTLSLSNIGVVGIWIALMVWQGLCVIYFTPLMGAGQYGTNK